MVGHASGINGEDFVVMAFGCSFIGGVDEEVAGGVPVGCPVDELVVGELDFAFDAVGSALVIVGEFGDEQLEEVVALAVRAVGDPVSVGGEKGAAVVALGGDDGGDEVGGEIADVDVWVTGFGVNPGVDNGLAVGRVGAFGVVAGLFEQGLDDGADGARFSVI